MNFPGASLASTHQLPKAQFRAVVLCGYGQDLYPLVEPAAVRESDDDDDDDDDDVRGGVGEEQQGRDGLQGTGQQKEAPLQGAEGALGQVKALLPVAGRRMVDWVLDKVEAAGIFDILVLTPASVAPPLAHHLRTRRASASASMSSSPTAKVELEEVPESVARNQTVAVLRWAIEQDHIKTDFILLPCDLLMSPSPSSPLSLAALLDRHRVDDNLLTTLFYERTASSVIEARKDGPAEMLSIYDPATSTLLDLREMDEFPSDEIPLRLSLFSRFPSPVLSTSLLPSQIYVFSASVLPFIHPATASSANDRRLRHMENLRELVGWLARLKWRNRGRDAVGYRPPSALHREDGLALGRSTTQPLAGAASLSSSAARRLYPVTPGVNDSMPQTGANTPALHAKGGSSGNPWEAAQSLVDGVGKRSRAGVGGCKVVVWRAEDGWCGRANTVAGWVEMNRAALKLLPPAPPPTNTPPGVFISPDSLLHPTVYPNLAEKVGVKRSILGKGCFVGKGSKLTNVVAMEGVVIGENVKLDNCVLSNGVQVRDRAVLKDCELGRNVIVDSDSQLKNEQLVVESE